jgi:hypothetical protein
VIRLVALVLLSCVLGCSDVTEGAGGVVQLEIRVPAVSTLEVGETLLFSATALDRDGNPVSTPVTWLSSDPITLDVTAAGLATGVGVGAAQVQAFAGSLASERVGLTVITRADTLVLVGDSVVTVPLGVTASAPLVVRLQAFSDATPLPNRPIVYTVTSPPDVGTRSVELPGAVLIDTVLSGSNGINESVTLNRVSGIPSPDTAIVQVRSYRSSGVDVPGSGQRFIVLFQ